VAQPPDLSGLARIRSTKATLARAVAAACQEYANGGFRAAPIVRQHFTQGNQGRYNWAALSPRYAARKAGLTPALKNGMRKGGKVVPKGKALPMLVATGTLRDAITSGRAKVVRQSVDLFVITWENSPHYAIYLHQGTPNKMPKRSPVEPNDADRRAIIEAAQRFLSASLGTAGNVPLGIFGGRARV
jgi:hypothetical protein